MTTVAFWALPDGDCGGADGAIGKKCIQGIASTQQFMYNFFQVKERTDYLLANISQKAVIKNCYKPHMHNNKGCAHSSLLLSQLVSLVSQSPSLGTKHDLP